MRYGLFALLLTTGALAAPASAQIPAAPKELGMGGAFVGVSRGYESLFLAPANLALPDAPSWSVGFPQMAIGLTVLGPEFSDLPDFIDFDDISAERQDELLSLIPLDGIEGRLSFRAPIGALSVGPVAVGVQYAATGRHTLSRDLAELFLRGYEDGRTDYSVGNTFGDLATYWDFAAAYARPIGDVAMGVTGHYYRGGTLSRTRLFEPRIDLEAQDVEVDYVGVSAEGGSGFGLDVGAAYSITPEFTASATFSNVLSTMSWSEDLRVRNVTLDRDMIEDTDGQGIIDQYDASIHDLDPTAASLQVYQAAEGLYDDAYFPTVARLGLAWQPLATTRVGVDVHRKITEGRLADEWEQRFAVGVQQSLWIFKLRAGYGAGDEGGNIIGGGLSVGPLDLGLASYQRSKIDDDASRGYVFTFGLGVSQP